MAAVARRFVLLVYRMPIKPAAARVATWRQLKRLGAVYPQQSVCVFPDEPSIMRDLRPTLEKIEDSGGEYHLLPLRKLSEEEEAKIIALFVDQSAKQYQEVIENCEVNFTKEIEFETFRKNFTYEEAEEIRVEFEKIGNWFNRVQQRDWFNAPNREEAASWLKRCEAMLEEFEARVYQLQGDDGGEAGLRPSGRRSARPTPINRAGSVRERSSRSLKHVD